MKRRVGAVITFLLLCGSVLAETMLLSNLNLDRVNQGWGEPSKNCSVDGTPLNIAGAVFKQGIGTHAASSFTVDLHQTASRFQAMVGVDNDDQSIGSVEFLVLLDGQIKWRSGIMKGGEKAKRVELDLTGVKTMTLKVTDGGDGNVSDHADWADATIEFQGKVPEMAHVLGNFPPVMESPGGPPNAAAQLVVGDDHKSLELKYNDRFLLKGFFTKTVQVESVVTGDRVVEQHIQLAFEKETLFKAVIEASLEAMAAETRGSAQKKFPLVRTSHGLSNNLRNNAIYDRGGDWMLEAPEGALIRSSRKADGTTQFELSFRAKNAELIFRPRYYQKHKNIPYFEPWTYRVKTQSITGWCSWWAYRRDCTQSDVDAVMKVWKKKHFADYGYHYIQLDDAFQGGSDANRKAPSALFGGYVGGRPETWLEWKKNLFPAGIKGYVRAVKKEGFIPALWVGSFFTDKEIADKHPEWFVQGSDGKPFVGNWITYVVDSLNPVAANALIRPTFRGLRKAGFKYIKIDQLRHMLYDNLFQNHAYMTKTGKRPDDIFRAYLKIAREELGRDCFILSCWGVLPESVGLADACRIGGDGYGPVTMQQYNSWNGIVWRNDPDHCDIMPHQAGVGTGNVTQTKAVQAAANDSIIRPALASIAGCMLILSDKPEVYENDRNLRGARRSAPVLFSVPGQLYDFDPQKTDVVKKVDRAYITWRDGHRIDGDQFGYVCPFWLNEFNMPYENWNVLHRLNWAGSSEKTAPPVTIKFADLGLDPDASYLVYEFWSNRFLGILKDEIKLGALEPRGLQSLAIRKNLNRPQLVSTNRHLSQGAAEIDAIQWANNTLTGRSKVIAEDRYVITLNFPAEYIPIAATINGKEADVFKEGDLMKISYLPSVTESIIWQVVFSKK